jgi:hypothetical protein
MPRPFIDWSAALKELLLVLKESKKLKWFAPSVVWRLLMRNTLGILPKLQA